MRVDDPEPADDRTDTFVSLESEAGAPAVNPSPTVAQESRVAATNAPTTHLYTACIDLLGSLSLPNHERQEAARREFDSFHFIGRPCKGLELCSARVLACLSEVARREGQAIPGFGFAYRHSKTGE